MTTTTTTFCFGCKNPMTAAEEANWDAALAAGVMYSGYCTPCASRNAAMALADGLAAWKATEHPARVAPAPVAAPTAAPVADRVISVTITPTGSERIRQEIERAVDANPVLDTLALGKTYVRGTAAALETLLEGLEITFDADLEADRIADHLGGNYTEARVEFGVSRARASHAGLCRAIRRALGRR